MLVYYSFWPLFLRFAHATCFPYAFRPLHRIPFVSGSPDRMNLLGHVLASREGQSGGSDCLSASCAVRCEPRLARIGLELGCLELPGSNVSYKYAVFHFFFSFHVHLLPSSILSILAISAGAATKRSLQSFCQHHTLEDSQSSNSSCIAGKRSSPANSRWQLSCGRRLARSVSFALLALPKKSLH
jgi:hypothetical protein